MFSDKAFIFAFVFSLGLHGLILFNNPKFHIFNSNKVNEKIEVSYLKESLPKKEILKKPANKQEPFLKTSAKISPDRRTPPPFAEKEKILKRSREIISTDKDFAKPNLVKSETIAIKKKITLPPIDMNKINSPSYISYYQIVREKIKRAAYRNYTRTETGEVYLSFVITTDGLLKETRLNETRSSPSQYLRDTALRSINDALPFPSFPKELDYPQLSFNVAISFEIE